MCAYTPKAYFFQEFYQFELYYTYQCCISALEATGLDEDDGNKGLIIGMVLGWGLLAVLIIAGVVFFIIYRKRYVHSCFIQVAWSQLFKASLA